MPAAEGCSAKWVTVAWSSWCPEALVCCFIPLFSSWIIAAAPIIREKPQPAMCSWKLWSWILWQLTSLLFFFLLFLRCTQGNLLQHGLCSWFSLKRGKETLVFFFRPILQEKSPSVSFWYLLLSVSHWVAHSSLPNWWLGAVRFEQQQQCPLLFSALCLSCDWLQERVSHAGCGLPLQTAVRCKGWLAPLPCALWWGEVLQTWQHVLKHCWARLCCESSVPISLSCPALSLFSKWHELTVFP